MCDLFVFCFVLILIFFACYKLLDSNLEAPEASVNEMSPRNDSMGNFTERAGITDRTVTERQTTERQTTERRSPSQNHLTPHKL